MHIFITNDDGIDARGLYVLANTLSQTMRVTVIAPDAQQSAVGHALTMSVPLRVENFFHHEEFFGLAVNGTPADCVKLGLRTLLVNDPPDIIISGINHGQNTAVNIIYSGTVSAATEATMLGFPGIAVSLATYDSDPDYSPAAEFIRDFIPVVLSNELPKGTLLNINVPALPKEQLRGVKFTRQGTSFWNDCYEERHDPRGGKYYWLKGEYVVDHSDEDIDDRAVREGFISITPLHYELTDTKALEVLRKWEMKSPFVTVNDF